MIRIQHIRRFAAVLAGVACALLASAALAAPSFAMVPHLQATVVAPPPHVTATVVAGGMPGWQITLIAVGAALQRPPRRFTSTGPAPRAGTWPGQPPEPGTRSEDGHLPAASPVIQARAPHKGIKSRKTAGEPG